MLMKTKIKGIENRLVTLRKIKCPPGIKKKLREAARDWLVYIKQHISEIHRDDEFEMYHNGEINFIKLFFNLDKKTAVKYKK
jgi:hypothetical protein